MLAGASLSPLLMKAMGGVKGMRLGTITYSYHDLPNVVGKNAIDAIIEDCKGSGVEILELMSTHCQPYTQAQAELAASRARSGATASGGFQTQDGGEPTDPDAKKIRDDLRQWRLSTPMSYFTGIKKQLSDAGISVYAYTVNQMGPDYADDELDIMFQQAKALGAVAVSSSTTIANTKRAVPFAEKHKIPIGVHGHTNVENPNEYAGPDSFKRGMALSNYVKVNLDIGHFTAANFDAVAFIQENHDRITHLHIKDRKKNGGPNEPWGQGETPIKEVLALLEQNHYPIPAIIELEYPVPAGSNCTAEVKKCMDYMKQSLDR
jgi:sugar phosphate isomerase/epimerase